MLNFLDSKQPKLNKYTSQLEGTHASAYVHQVIFFTK